MLNVAIIGLGAWGKRLVDSVQGKSEKIRFTHAVTRTPSKVEEFARERGIALGDALRPVLDDAEVQAVVAAGPAAQHAPHGMAALSAGKPVMVVKPLALRAMDAEMLARESEKSGVPVIMGYNRAFLPGHIELKRRLQAGDLGIPLHAEGDFCVRRYADLKPDSWKTDINQSPPGGLADHMLYEMISVFGPVEEVHAMAAKRVVTSSLMDTTAVVLRFREGTTGSLTAIGATPDFYRLHVFGSTGWAEARGSRGFTFQPVDGKREEIEMPAVDTLRAELETFADAVTGAGPFPMSLAQAVHGVAVLEAIARSAEERHPVAVSGD